MPAIAGEPFRAHAVCSHYNAVNGSIGNVGIVTVDLAVGGLGGAPTNADVAARSNDKSPWEGLPGDALSLAWFERQNNLAGGANPTARRVRVYTWIGGVQVGVEWNPTGDNQGRTLHFDDDPLNALLGAALRAGTLELWCGMEGGSGVGSYVINSRGTGQTLPTGQASDWGRGYVRSRLQLASFARSRVGLGSADNDFAYADTMFQRAVLSAQLYESMALTHKLRQSGVEKRSLVGAAAALTHDATFSAASGLAARVNDDFAVGTADGRLVTPASFVDTDRVFEWAETGHAAGWTKTGEAQLDASGDMTVDPVVRVTRHLQVNDNVLAAAKNIVTGQRLNSDLGFIAAKLSNKRGEPVVFTNVGAGRGLDYNFRDNGALTPNKQALDQATDANGFGPAMQWAEGLPGGAWTLTLDFTDEAGQQTLDDSTQDYVLLASDPRVVLITGGGNTSDPRDHWRPGEPFIAAFQAVSAADGGPLAIDAGSGRVALCRLNVALARGEYLRGDNTWQPLAGGAPEFYATSASPGDANVQMKQFTLAGGFDTTNWGTYEIVVLSKVTIGSTPYARFSVVPCVGAFNKHSAQSFDPTGLFA